MGRTLATAFACLFLPVAFVTDQTPVPAAPRPDAPHQPVQPSTAPTEVTSDKPESEARLMGCLVPGPSGSFVLEDATNGAPGAAPGQKFMIIASEKLELAKHVNKRVTFSEVANSTSAPPAVAAAATAAATAAAVSGVSLSLSRGNIRRYARCRRACHATIRGEGHHRGGRRVQVGQIAELCVRTFGTFPSELASRWLGRATGLPISASREKMAAAHMAGMGMRVRRHGERPSPGPLRRLTETRRSRPRSRKGVR